ncbi:MAG: hypothetical protein AAFU66_04655 [Pseudomonadota bacterium]
MGKYEDLKRLLKAVHEYKTEGTIPADADELDDLCERILANNPFDATAIDWKRIGEYEKEVNGGDWPLPD